MTLVLPLPVTPMRTCSRRPERTPSTSSAMACGWSPLGSKGAGLRKGPDMSLWSWYFERPFEAPLPRPGPRAQPCLPCRISGQPLWLLEARLEPDPPVQIVLDCRAELVRRRSMPASAEPSADAAPRVARTVLAAPLDIVEPGLPALEADAPDRVGGVRIHRSRRGDARPGSTLVRIAVLQQTEALRAQPRLAVRAEAMARRTRTRVCSPVTQVRLVPPAFLGGLGVDQVFVHAPLACRPAQDLLGRALEGTIHTSTNLCVGA